jgi:hypothetical protein
MTEPNAVYRTRASGLWSSSHAFSGPEGPLGVLDTTRNWHGMVTSGHFQPAGAGEELLFRRDPGLLRSQFSLWTAHEPREWLGSSLRANPLQRSVTITTGNKPYELLPTPELGRGWILRAPKTGVSARLRAGLVSRSTTIEVYRRLDFSLVVFLHFLGTQILCESLLPGERPHDYQL